MIRACAVAILLALAGPAIAQPPALRDRYGHPDLEGMWAARWLTSLERPVGTPLVLDAAGAAARARQILADRGKADAFDIEISDPDARSLAMVRGEHRASLIVEPSDGRLPLSDAGRAYLAATPPPGTDGPEQRALNERCIGGQNLPGALIPPAASLRRVVQTRDSVLLYAEAFGELRVFSPGAGPQAVGLGTWEGQTNARWEGDALVVESTGFRPDNRIRGAPFSRFPLRPQTRIVERFSRIGRDELLYAFEVDDPVLYTRPWRAEYSLVRTHERIFEFACHEGNYGLAGILGGARVEERAAAKP